MLFFKETIYCVVSFNKIKAFFQKPENTKFNKVAFEDKF